MVLCQEIIESLKIEVNDNFESYPELYLLQLECEYMLKRNEKDLMEKTKNFFSNPLVKIEPKMKAKTFFKQGSWMLEKH